VRRGATDDRGIAGDIVRRTAGDAGRRASLAVAGTSLAIAGAALAISVAVAGAACHKSFGVADHAAVVAVVAVAGDEAAGGRGVNLHACIS